MARTKIPDDNNVSRIGCDSRLVRSLVKVNPLGAEPGIGIDGDSTPIAAVSTALNRDTNDLESGTIIHYEMWLPKWSRQDEGRPVGGLHGQSAYQCQLTSPPMALRG